MLDVLRVKLRALEDRLSLRVQVGVATAVLCVGLAGALATSAAYVAHTRVERMVREEMVNLAVASSEALDHFMHLRYQEVRALAALEILQDAWTNDPARIRQVLGGMQRGLPDYSWVGFADRDGIVRAASQSMLEGASVAERPWFAKGLSAPTAVDVHAALLLERLLPASASGEPLRFVDVAAPVRDAKGNVVGVIAAHLNWRWAAGLRDSLLARRLDADTRIAILSQDGVVLLGEGVGGRPFSPAELVQMQGSGRGTLAPRPGDSMLTGYAVGDGHLDYPGLGWTVIAQRPAALAHGAARVTAAIILGIGALLACLGVAVSMLIAGRVARPLRQLTAQADRIGRDPHAVSIRRQHGSAEVLQLSTALRALLGRVGFAEQRTREVEASASESAEQFARDLKDLRHLAETDALTGLANRRAFAREGVAAFEHVKRYGRPIALLAIDIDHFKRINDRYGHAAGDRGICKAGEIISAMVRTTDTAARIGGEEFMVLLREADEAEARALAERVRAGIAAAVVRSGEAEYRMTLSVGIAVASDADEAINDVMERADQGLYMAKNTGRNRVFFMPVTEPDGVSRVA